MIAIAAIAIVASMLALKFKAIKPEYSVLIGLFASIYFAFYVMEQLKSIIALFSVIQTNSGISKTYIEILLKIIGISFLSDFTANICKDAGQSTLGKQVEMAGKISILIISLPIIKSLLRTIQQLME